MENHVPVQTSEPPAPAPESPPLQPVPCNSCTASGVPCQVRTEAKFAKAACRRCHKNKTSCSLSGARRPPKPKPSVQAPPDLLRGPVTLPSSNAGLYGPFNTSHVRGPVFGGSSSYTFSPPEPSANASAFPGPPPPPSSIVTTTSAVANGAPATSTSAPTARRLSVTSVSAPASRPIAPLPARPVHRLSLASRDLPAPPPPPAGTQQYEEVLRRQLNAAQAALRAAHAEKDAVVAERDALVLSVRAEAAARHAEASQSHAAEARIAASADYVERSHTAFTKLFTEPRLRGEDDSVTLEMMREMWVAFAQGQLEVLEGRNRGRDLEDLLSEEAVDRARRVIDGSLREQERRASMYAQEGEDGEDGYRYELDRDAEGEVLLENGEEERDELASPSPPKMEEELAAAHHVLALGQPVTAFTAP